jgi:hypothetical protein
MWAGNRNERKGEETGLYVCVRLQPVRVAWKARRLIIEDGRRAAPHVVY